MPRSSPIAVVPAIHALETALSAVTMTLNTEKVAANFRIVGPHSTKARVTDTAADATDEITPATCDPLFCKYCVSSAI